MVIVAALFTIAETWKQPKCPSTDEWVKNMWHVQDIQLNNIQNLKRIPNNKLEMDSQ